MTEENTLEKAPKPKRKISWITIVFVTVGVVALGAALIIPQFNTYCCRSHDSDSKADLHNIFLACKAYWADNGSESICSPEIASGPAYGYIQSADVTISARGTETDFSGTAQSINSTKTFQVDFNGTITP